MLSGVCSYVFKVKQNIQMCICLKPVSYICISVPLCLYVYNSTGQNPEPKPGPVIPKNVKTTQSI